MGKFTVAKELAKLTNFKIFHNHSVKDQVWNFFERGTLSDHKLSEEITFLIFKQIAEDRLSVILTNTHSADFVSKTGLTNMGLYKKINQIVKKRGGEVFHIQLIAEPRIILKRTVHPGRKTYKKLVDHNVMKQVLKEKDWFSPAKLKNNLIINNTKLAPKKVAGIIRQHFKLQYAAQN